MQLSESVFYVSIVTKISYLFNSQIDDIFLEMKFLDQKGEGIWIFWCFRRRIISSCEWSTCPLKRETYNSRKPGVAKLRLIKSLTAALLTHVVFVYNDVA